MMDDDIDRLRVPPHSLEAEQSVLGSLLQDNGAWDRVADLLAESDFYRHEHRLIFGAMAGLILANKPADVVTVFERLGDRAADVGGLLGLNALAQSVASAGNARRYAEIVRERAILRRLIAASDEIATAAFNTQGRPVAELLGEAEAKVLAIGQSEGRGQGSAHSMDRLMLSMIQGVEERYERGSTVVGVPTGFMDLDRSLSGMQPGDLLVLAARPSMGKSALAINIAEHVAVKEGLPVIVFSMEMGATQLALRMAASQGHISAQALRTGNLEGDDAWGRLSEVVERLSKAPMVIDDGGGIGVAEVRARARRLARDLGGRVSLIVVDYLQLMPGAGDENRATELGAISGGLKALAKELQCPVLALSQLNRGVESRNDKRPMMSDLRDSGAIEQDADVILFIYRDDYYNKDSREPGVAEINIAKQRSGPTGTVKLAWRPIFTRFESLAHDYAPPPPPPPRARQQGKPL